MKTKYVCFTHNNWQESDLLYYRSLVGRGICTYCIVAREVGESGTRHLQGYCEFPRRKRFAQIHSILPGAHVEARRGRSEEAADYCRKDGAFDEFGDISLPRPGNRSDLDLLHESLRRRQPMVVIADEHFGPFLKYQRGINAYRLATALPRSDPPAVVVYWGRTGTGKTRAVWDNAASLRDVWVYGGGGWFDSYDEQTIALFDDFTGSELKLTFLLKVLDRYPLRVPIKGGFVNWRPLEIYITSNLEPASWYSGASQTHVDALFRRFTNVVHFQ